MVVVGDPCGCGCGQLAPFDEHGRRRRFAMRGHYVRGIPAAPVREAVEASGVTLYELARRIGYDETPRRRRNGERRVRRMLDQAQVSRANAVRILAAAGCDPVDVGVL